MAITPSQHSTTPEWMVRLIPTPTSIHTNLYCRYSCVGDKTQPLSELAGYCRSAFGTPKNRQPKHLLPRIRDDLPNRERD
ncbi:hypothetical protein GJ744_004139 [Endocarpon pusillum]|uniref:Uncharacterized protein n=1 Tax=Endocarpon pusillum TaxID=364733 RepID=A0A8H7AR71_9EURO|nr:hypothetical protein GJ744_004139 [Endocarpon pusillum]